MLLLSYADIYQIDCIADQHEGTFKSADSLPGRTEDPDKEGKNCQYADINKVLHIESYGSNNGTNTKDGEIVEDIRSNNITNCHIQLFLTSCDERGYKFRKRGSRRNDG